MSPRLVFRPEAQAELAEAHDWYERQRPGLGAAFSAAVDAALASIIERPLAYPRVRGEMRRAILRRFPYGVFFRLIDDEIVVLGIVHGRRHPPTWKSRR